MAKKLHRIKEVLKEKGKTAYWLALETEITYKSINGYVNHKIEPSLTNLHRIGKALQVSVKELVTD